MWDQTNRPVSFLVRVTLDTKDLSSRIRQAFPGADVKVRQVGPQIILDGQVPDSKTMSDIIQLVSFTLMTSPSLRGTGGMGGGGMGGGGGAAGGGGMGGGGMGGGTGGMAGAGSDDAHQSHDRAGTPASAAPRQDRRDQSQRHAHAWRELALCSRAIDLWLGTAGHQRSRRDLYNALPRPIHRPPTPLALSSPCKEPSADQAPPLPARIRPYSVCSTPATFRCSSKPCAPTVSPRSWPSPTWLHSMDSPRGSWSAGCSRSPFPRALRSPVERPW